MILKDRYNLTQNQSIFLAKKLVKESIYSGVKLEGINLTFPETQAILDNVNVPHASIDDIQTVLNMRDAWKYVLKTFDEPFTLDYICKINSYVSRNESLEWGVLRKGKVGITGTDYVPQIPIKENVTKVIENILSSNTTTTEKALHYFMWAAKNQLFWDGNKRTSLICANKILLQDGKGIFTIRDSNVTEFNTLLTAYYEDDGMADHLMKFLYSNSIKGIDFENNRQDELER